MKLETVAMVVAIFADAAIISVFCFPKITTNSTSETVKTVLNICSIVCDFAVTEKLCLPLKYPLITDVIDTKNIDGESAIKEYFASGICIHLFEIVSAPAKRSKEPIIPINAKVTNAILKILCAPLLSPTANLSDTKYEIALGTPVDENVRSNAYI